MRPEDYIRKKIRQLLMEQRVPVSSKRTQRIGGGVRKEFRDLKARSETRPRELMDDLGVSSLKGDEKHQNLHSLIAQAVVGNEIMSTAYSDPEHIRDEFDRKAIRIKVVGDIAPRDGVFFIRHTVRGAKKAGLVPFDDKVAIELLGDDVVVYVAKTPYSWNTPLDVKKTPEKEEEDENGKK